MSQEGVIRIGFKTTIKIAFLTSMIGILSSALVKERYLLLISLINLILSLYIIKTYR